MRGALAPWVAALSNVDRLRAVPPTLQPPRRVAHPITCDVEGRESEARALSGALETTRGRQAEQVSRSQERTWCLAAPLTFTGIKRTARAEKRRACTELAL